MKLSLRRPPAPAGSLLFHALSVLLAFALTFLSLRSDALAKETPAPEEKVSLETVLQNAESELTLFQDILSDMGRKDSKWKIYYRERRAGKIELVAAGSGCAEIASVLKGANLRKGVMTPQEREFVRRGVINDPAPPRFSLIFEFEFPEGGSFKFDFEPRGGTFHLFGGHLHTMDRGTMDKIEKIVKAKLNEKKSTAPKSSDIDTKEESKPEEKFSFATVLRNTRSGWALFEDVLQTSGRENSNWRIYFSGKTHVTGRAEGKDRAEIVDILRNASIRKRAASSKTTKEGAEESPPPYWYSLTFSFAIPLRIGFSIKLDIYGDAHGGGPGFTHQNFCEKGENCLRGAQEFDKIATFFVLSPKRKGMTFDKFLDSGAIL